MRVIDLRQILRNFTSLVLVTTLAFTIPAFSSGSIG